MRRPVNRFSTSKTLAPLPTKVTGHLSVHVPTTMHQIDVATADTLDRTDMSRWTRNFDLMASISRIRGGPGRVVPKDTHGRYLSQQKQRIRQH
jgi:hypothetical protein